MASPIIALLSDFGTRGHYVAAMKGVILTLAPDVRLVDLAHDVPHFDIDEGAQTLALASREFPAGTVFVAVVDPGVGTARRGVAARTLDGSLWVGPDNGLLWPVIEERGLDDARELTNPRLWRNEPNSRTFHGRDLFAPVGAHLALGVPLHEVGLQAGDLMGLELPKATYDGSVLRGCVQRTDEFGNLITSIAAAVAREMGAVPGAGRFAAQVGSRPLSVLPFLETYAAAGGQQDALVLVDSSGYLELAANRASYADLCGGRAGDPVRLEWLPR